MQLSMFGLDFVKYFADTLCEIYPSSFFCVPDAESTVGPFPALLLY